MYLQEKVAEGFDLGTKPEIELKMKVDSPDLYWHI
jgi:hypothetical protein